MRGIQRMIPVTLMIVLLFLGVSPLGAKDFKFKSLSKDHTAFGVSQLVVGNISGGQGDLGGAPIKLMNPIPVTQVSAILVYERSNELKSKGTPGLFRGCEVRKLLPHAAVGVSATVFEDILGGDKIPLYAEVISVPETPAHKKERLGNGLGIIVRGAYSETEFSLLYPELFSLPSDDLAPGQEQEAIDCICAAVAFEVPGADPDLFEEFGIRCP